MTMSETITDTEQYRKDLCIAKEVLTAEAAAISETAENLSAEDFGQAVDLIHRCRAEVVCTGMGKSGHIARKVAATLASTGTPSFFLHPGEAMHGDLGMLHSDSLVIAFSNSGTTEEIVNLFPYISQFSIPVIAITANRESPLARQATVFLKTWINGEACPLNLAPTSSTTAQLAMGDALAMAVMKRRGFTPEDFAIRHPLGALGRRLLFKVSDLMHKGEEIPAIIETAFLRDAISQMTKKRLGTVVLVNEAGKMTGIFTDGDLRRLFDRQSGQIDGNETIGNVMVKNPKSIEPDILGVKAVDLMESYKITVLPVCDDDGTPVGLIHLHDLIQAGIAR